MTNEYEYKKSDGVENLPMLARVPAGFSYLHFHFS